MATEETIRGKGGRVNYFAHPGPCAEMEDATHSIHATKYPSLFVGLHLPIPISSELKGLKVRTRWWFAGQNRTPIALPCQNPGFIVPPVHYSMCASHHYSCCH